LTNQPPQDGSSRLFLAMVKTPAHAFALYDRSADATAYDYTWHMASVDRAAGSGAQETRPEACICGDGEHLLGPQLRLSCEAPLALFACAVRPRAPMIADNKDGRAVATLREAENVGGAGASVHA
jgi:hypothetical protein